MGAELATKPAADLEQEAPAFLAWAKALRVTSPDDMASAAEQLKAIKTLAKRVADVFGPMKRSADAAKKAILDQEKRLTVPLTEAERLAKAAILSYQTAEQEKARAEQRRLQAEADERSRREREALEKKAAAAKKPETKERYTEQAAQVVAPVVSVASEAPTVAGISTRTIWRARIVDAAQIPREFLTVDVKALDGYARAMKERANVPGVQFYEESILSASGR